MLIFRKNHLAILWKDVKKVYRMLSDEFDSIPGPLQGAIRGAAFLAALAVTDDLYWTARISFQFPLDPAQLTASEVIVDKAECSFSYGRLNVWDVPPLPPPSGTVQAGMAVPNAPMTWVTVYASGAYKSQISVLIEEPMRIFSTDYAAPLIRPPYPYEERIWHQVCDS